jgi:hypothetical protein
MRWTTLVFLAALGTLAGGSFLLSYTGPEKAGSLSLRNVQARRTHFVRYYAFGK